MSKAVFCFLGNLNDLLPYERRHISFIHSFKDHPSIKDVIESFGLPHPEVNGIVVNDNSVNFNYLWQDSDRVTVYPYSILPDLPSTSIIQLQPNLPEQIGFILDVHLGKLAASLRLLGFDTLYRNDYKDEEIAQIAADEHRIVLTRDKGLLMRKAVIYGYYVRETNPKKQLTEVLKRFNLLDLCQPFRRCTLCNGLIKSVDKSTIIEHLPEQTRQSYQDFYQCDRCHQIYWQGTHLPLPQAQNHLSTPQIGDWLQVAQSLQPITKASEHLLFLTFLFP